MEKLRGDVKDYTLNGKSITWCNLGGVSYYPLGSGTIVVTMDDDPLLINGYTDAHTLSLDGDNIVAEGWAFEDAQEITKVDGRPQSPIDASRRCLVEMLVSALRSELESTIADDKRVNEGRHRSSIYCNGCEEQSTHYVGGTYEEWMTSNERRARLPVNAAARFNYCNDGGLTIEMWHCRECDD